MKEGKFNELEELWKVSKRYGVDVALFADFPSDGPGRLVYSKKKNSRMRVCTVRVLA